jgi:geranylgeranyl diphosphate synthase type II
MMNKKYKEYKSLVDAALNLAINEAAIVDSKLYDAIKYALSTPGKRIRGVLTLHFCNRLGVDASKAIPFAVALEMIHAYSLVHDDLPEMDNDDFRRGAPTCHKKYGTAFALLAGDAILNYSLEYLLERRSLYSADLFLNAVEQLYNASGAKGMLDGQAIDILGESTKLTMDQLLELHSKKTGALLLAPIKIAEALSGTEQKNLCEYAKKIGLAFQIKDDILDVEGNADTLGKETGKDLQENKSTFITILGIKEAKEYLEKEIGIAKSMVKGDLFLEWIADYIANRQY